jgi:hypothetical protein
MLLFERDLRGHLIFWKNENTGIWRSFSHRKVFMQYLKFLQKSEKYVII